MLIDLHASQMIRNHGCEYLTAMHTWIKTLHNLYVFLDGDLNRHLTDDYKEMGIQLEQCLLFEMEPILADIDMNVLKKYVLAGSTGAAVGDKCVSALVSTEDILENLFRHISSDDPFTVPELHDIQRALSYTLGDLLYAFSKILYNPADAHEIILSTETFEYSQIHQEFFSSIGYSPEQYAQKLESMRSNFVSVIPLFKDRPEEWLELTQSLEPSIADTLLELGSYISEFEIRAWKLGLFQPDEIFIDDLRMVAEDANAPKNQVPHAWLQFSRMLTDEQISKLYPIYTELTADDVVLAVEDNGKTVPDEYVQHLLRLHGGNADANTNYFEAQ